MRQQIQSAAIAYQEALHCAGATDEKRSQALYGLGYAYFNLADYAQAMPYFAQYTSLKKVKTPATWRQDA